MSWSRSCWWFRLLLPRLIRFMISLSRLFSLPLLWPLLVMAFRFMVLPG
ncbi:hypothetical protein SRB521_01677 [Intestinimonas butyriciproducens]|nr:hypothetical protein SRB521_01677 [Intestinimonas butyriciproducens]